MNRLLNKKFNKLLVIEDSKKRGNDGSIIYKCLCECGKITYVRSCQIKAGKIKSCGCILTDFITKLNKKRCLPKGEAGYRKLYRAYKNGAETRGLIFNLDFEYFKNLVKSNCYYCGIPPIRIFKTYGNTTLYLMEAQNRANIFYNGIDRFDNTEGYTKENSVPCCKLCNYAKNVLTTKEFFEWIERLVKRWSRNHLFNNSIFSDLPHFELEI